MKFRRKLHWSNMTPSGQSMLEVAISLAVATVVIMALLSTVIGSLDGAQYSKNFNQATQYSQRGMEAIRTINGRYDDNVYRDRTYCLNSSVNPPVLIWPDIPCRNIPNIAEPNGPNRFIQKVALDHGAQECGGEFTKVTVSTSWVDGKCPNTGTNRYCHKSEIVSCATNL